MKGSDLARTEISPYSALIETINSQEFCVIGTVKKVYGEGRRVDVLLPFLTAGGKPREIKGVELALLGNQNVGFHLVPTVGDCVICVASKFVQPELTNYTSGKTDDGTAVPYSNTSLKAFPVCAASDDPAYLFEVDKDGKVTETYKEEFTQNYDGAVTITGGDTITIGNGSDSLGSMITELLDALAQMKTVGSPAQHSVAPDTQQTLNDLKDRWSKVFA